MKRLLIPLILFGASITSIVVAAVFSSQQVGTSPLAGSLLQTNGVTSTWVTTSSLGISGSGGSSTVLHSGLGWNVTALVGGSQTGTVDTSAALTWTALQTMNAGLTVAGNVTTTNLTITSIASGNCVHTGANGALSGTGSDCGAGGSASGTIISAAANQIAYYTASTTLNSTSSFTYVPPVSATDTAKFTLGVPSSTACMGFRNASDTGYIYNWFDALGPIWSDATSTYCNP